MIGLVTVAVAAVLAAGCTASPGVTGPPASYLLPPPAPKTSFPATHQVYGLEMLLASGWVTCTGDFGYPTGHYLGNDIVFTKEDA